MCQASIRWLEHIMVISLSRRILELYKMLELQVATMYRSEAQAEGAPFLAICIVASFDLPPALTVPYKSQQLHGRSTVLDINSETGIEKRRRLLIHACAQLSRLRRNGPFGFI